MTMGKGIQEVRLLVHTRQKIQEPMTMYLTCTNVTIEAIHFISTGFVGRIANWPFNKTRCK